MAKPIIPLVVRQFNPNAKMFVKSRRGVWQGKNIHSTLGELVDIEAIYGF